MYEFEVAPLPKGCQHRLHRRRVAKPCAVIDMVAAHDKPGKLLLDEAVFVRRLCRCESSKGVSAVFRQSFCNVVESFIPIDFDELVIPANQGLLDAVRVIHEREPKPALNAEHSKR